MATRRLDRVLRAPFDARHYRALYHMVRSTPDWPRVLRAYLFMDGASYPVRFRVGTPVGERAVVLYGHHDVLTLNEIFFRHDYPADGSTRVVVDVGANIGLSALWFLTRGPQVHCECYEPLHWNVDKLRETLKGLDSRYVLHEAAVADTAGSLTFGIEPTGRYGGLGRSTLEQITVNAVHINDVLQSALDRHGRIDILKVDVEGAEVPVLRAADPALLRRVRRIYVEEEEPTIRAIVDPTWTNQRHGSVVYYEHVRST